MLPGLGHRAWLAKGVSSWILLSLEVSGILTFPCVGDLRKVWHR